MGDDKEAIAGCVKGCMPKGDGDHKGDHGKDGKPDFHGMCENACGEKGEKEGWAKDEGAMKKCVHGCMETAPKGDDHGKGFHKDHGKEDHKDHGKDDHKDHGKDDHKDHGKEDHK